MSTPQQATLNDCNEKVCTKKCKTSRSLATIVSELSTVLCVSMAGGRKLSTGETSQSSSSSRTGVDDPDILGAMEREEESCSWGMSPYSARRTMANYGLYYPNKRLNGPINVMHRYIKQCLEGKRSETDSSVVFDHPLWSKLLTRATITKSMPISKVEKKMVPLMSFFKDWENSLRSGLGLKVLSSAETSEPKDLLLCQVGRLVKRDKVPGVASLWSYHTSFKHLLDRLSETASGELCDGLLFALKCMIAQYVSRPDWNNANQVVSVVCAIIRGDTGELLRLLSEFGTHMIEYKQMREHGFVLSIEGAKNAFGAMHRFILHCFKSSVKPRIVNHRYVDALWANSVWSMLLRHANVTHSMRMLEIRDRFLTTIMATMKHVENSVRSQLGLKPLVLPAPQESFVVCHLARLSEICRSSKTSDLEFDIALTPFKTLMKNQSISVTETPGSSHAKGVEWRKKLSDLEVDMDDFDIECENLVSSVLDDAFNFDVGEIASTSAVRFADLLKAKAETEALAKIKYNQYLNSRMLEAGLKRSSSNCSFFGLVQFLFGTRFTKPDPRSYPQRIRNLKRCSVWKSLLHRVESMEEEYLSPEQLVEQLYETENRLRRHFGLETILKDRRNVRREQGFLICHLATLCNVMENWKGKEGAGICRFQLKVWKKNFDQCFPTLPASHHLLQSTLSAIKGNCDGWEGVVSQAMNAVCRLIQSEDTGADVSPPTTPSLADLIDNVDWDEWNMTGNRTESIEVREAPKVPSMEMPTTPLLSICGTDLTTMQSNDEGLFHDCCESLADTESQDDCNDFESITPTIQSLGQHESDVTVGTVAQSLPAFASALPMMASFSSLTTNKLIDSCHFPLTSQMRERAMEEMDAESNALLKRKREIQFGPSMKRGN